MTTHLFEFELNPNDVGYRYADRIDPAAAWVETDDSLRVLAVPGPVGCVIAEFVDGVGAIRHGLNAPSRGQGTNEEQERSWKVLADVREAWASLVRGMNRRPALDPSGYELQYVMPPDGLYCLVQTEFLFLHDPIPEVKNHPWITGQEKWELRAVGDVTGEWWQYATERFDVSLHGRCEVFLRNHEAQHLLFTNDRGDEVVVDRELLR